MNIGNAFREEMRKYTEIMSQYKEYRPVEKRGLPFRQSQNDMESKIIKKVSIQNTCLLGLVAIVTAILAIFCIVDQQSLTAIVILLGMCVLSLYMLYKQMSRPAGILRGEVVYKEIARKNSSENRHDYYVTVVFEVPEKLLSGQIRTSAKDFQALEIGSPVYVVSSAGDVKAYPYCE